MTRESHIGRQKRRELCGRLFYFETIQPHKETFSKLGAGDTLDVVRDSLFVSLADPNTGQLPEEGLATTVLPRFLRTAESQLERYPEPLAELKSAASTRLSSLSCHGCNVDLSPSDQQAVIGQNGCCFTPLRQSFELAREVAYLYYSKFATQTKALPDIVFSTKHSLDLSDIHDLPVPYALGGSTEYGYQRGEHWSTVYLRFCIQNFDFDTYMAIPYVLFHECIAHAFHGLIPSAAGREGCGPDDGFSEGWMDFVAFRILEELGRGEGPAKHFRNALGLTQERYNRCHNLYISRININVSPPYKSSRHAPHLKTGNNAADKVLQCLRRLPETRNNPWQSFLQLSFDLNMLQQFNSNKRKRFVALLDNLAKPGQLDTLRHCDAVAVIRRYFQDRDIERFIAGVLSLGDLWLGKRPVRSPLPIFVRPGRQRNH